jgi:NAD(P)-dependent dehydrogenase (short-subunit alcohol dehydrogenase family)
MVGFFVRVGPAFRRKGLKGGMAMSERTYLVVGGSSGIGLEIVRRLTARGDAVIAVSRNAGLLSSLPNLTHIPADVVGDDGRFSSSQLPETLQGLVYCPGSIRLRPFQRLGEEDFLEDFRINLLGAVRTIKAGLTSLKKSTDGAAVVLFSTVAAQTGMPFHAAVASAKGAVEGLTRSLAAEFAPRIRVNAIAPSLTDTPLAGELLKGEERRKAAADRNPLKRIGTPADAASLAVFLLSPEASWITGQVIRVDGGMSALRTFK